MSELGRERDAGTWTGWLVDQDTMKDYAKQIDPEGYLANYPRSRVTGLNTMFTGFALYHHKEWLKLDHFGSRKAKAIIKKSKSQHGYWAMVEGIRKGDKITVSEIREIVHPSRVAGGTSDDSDEHKKRMRSDFQKFNL